MSRILVVAYRPRANQRAAVLGLLHEQHTLVRRLGLIGDREPWLMEGAHGEIIYVAAFDDASQVDACWENADFQDVDVRLNAVAELVPMRTIQEASGSFMDFSALPLAAPAA